MANGAADAVLGWLLEESNPSIRFRTLTELLGKSRRSSAVRESQEAIPRSPLVSRAFSRLDDQGNSCDADPASEYWRIGLALAELAELGMTVADQRVSSAIDRFFAIREVTTPFPDDENTCYYTQHVRSLVMLGAKDDPRVASLLQRLCRPCRHDGGLICNKRHRGKNKNTPAKKSCYIECAKALSAFAELPEYWQTDTCRGLVDYFLRRRVCFRTDDFTKPVIPAAIQTRFPFLLPDGNTSLLENVYALARMGFANDERMRDAFACLETFRLEDGRYKLHLANRNSLLGLRSKQPDKFVALYAYLANAHRDNRE